MFNIALQTIFYEYQKENHRIKTSFVNPRLQLFRDSKTGFNLIFFPFDFRGMLSIIRYNNGLFFQWPKHSKPQLWSNVAFERGRAADNHQRRGAGQPVVGQPGEARRARVLRRSLPPAHVRQRGPVHSPLSDSSV